MNRKLMHRYIPINKKCIIILFLLILSSIPSVANVSYKFYLAGFEVDISFYQSIIILLFCMVILRKKKFFLTMSTRSLLIILWLIVTFNMTSALMMDRELLTPLMRGIFNFSVNVLVALTVSQFISNRANAMVFALAIVLFGIVVSFSALGEFGLLKTSESMLEKWRMLVRGSSTDPESLFSAGGVTLNPMGLSRVGGLIGAPENLGCVLALTLPFILFLGLSPMANAGIVALYVLSTIVSGSRTLGIALIVYSIVLVIGKFGFSLKHKIAVIIALAFSSMLSVWFSINPEIFIRYSRAAFLHEMEWRSNRLLALLETMRENGLNWIIGLGLGWGVDQHFGLHSLTSGILGGDLAVAYCLGGIIGLAVLIALWAIILRVSTKIRLVFGPTRVAMNMYVLFLAAYSLLTPVLMQLILSSGIITLLLMTFLVLAETTPSGLDEFVYRFRVKPSQGNAHKPHVIV